MMTIADLEIDKLRAHIESGGFLTSFTDIYGSTQPPMVLQMNEADDTAIGELERIIMIRSIGGFTNPANRTLYKERNMLILIVGQMGESDSVICQGFAESLETWLAENYTDGACLTNITSSGVSGPFAMPSGRRAWEINITCSFGVDRTKFV